MSQKKEHKPCNKAQQSQSQKQSRSGSIHADGRNNRRKAGIEQRLETAFCGRVSGLNHADAS